MTEKKREFKTGANRDAEEGKPDPEGFLAPLVLDRFIEYMHENRTLKDGTFRDSDNWQKGMPRSVYMKSAFRHFLTWWGWHRHYVAGNDKLVEDALCGLLFNAMGYLYEILRAKQAATPAEIVRGRETLQKLTGERLLREKQPLTDPEYDALFPDDNKVVDDGWD